jgi:hypothetical protein
VAVCPSLSISRGRSALGKKIYISLKVWSPVYHTRSLASSSSICGAALATRSSAKEIWAWLGMYV